MTKETKVLIDNYKSIASIALKYLEISNWSEGHKSGYIYLIEYSLGAIEESPTKSLVKHYMKEMSRIWSYLLEIWVELFWIELQEKGLQLDRIDTVLKIIERGRFLGVGEAMEYKQNWQRIVDAGYVSSRYTVEQINFINALIIKNTDTRLTLLIKSIRNRKVNSSDYLKYGEAIAYFTNGRLFNEICLTDDIHLLFSKEEQRILEEIWK